MPEYKKYNNNLYVELPTGLHCIGINQNTSSQNGITVGSWSKVPVSPDLAEKISLQGKPVEPPWRDRQPKKKKETQHDS